MMEDFKYAFGLITFEGRSRCDLLPASILVLAKHGEHLPLSLFLDLISFSLCPIVLLPIICLRLVFLRRATGDDDWNIFLNLGSTSKRYQCFSAINLIMSAKLRAYVPYLSLIRALHACAPASLTHY